jgi:hypothetical protein
MESGTMPCAGCGAENPTWANYCMHCGQSLRWEYRDLVINLRLTTRDLPLESETRRRFDQLVREELRRSIEEGWQADGPIDWRSLTESSRFRWRAHAGVGGHYLLDAVVVRIKRPIPSRAPDQAAPLAAEPPLPAA